MISFIMSAPFQGLHEATNGIRFPEPFLPGHWYEETTTFSAVTHAGLDSVASFSAVCFSSADFPN